MSDLVDLRRAGTGTSGLPSITSRRPLRPPLTRNRRGIAPLLLILIIVVVAAIVVVGSLYAAGAFTPKSSSSAKTYTVTFVESGLTGSYTWSVVLGGTSHSSTTSTITFSEPNGTNYAFTVAAVTGYSASPSSGTITVNGAAVSQAITFTAVVATTYSVTFSETGLPLGTSWAVTLNGGTTSSSTSTIVFTEVNGTYAYSVGAVSGYSGSPSTGWLTVSGAGASQAITFTPTTETTYTLTFTETGLPGNTTWSVALQGASESSNLTAINFTEPNGTDAFTVGNLSGYAASPSSGNVTVSGSAVTQPIVFTPVSVNGSFQVTFDERRLPSGMPWTATLAGVSETSTGTFVAFSEPNGSYGFVISAAGYLASPPRGTVRVAGTDLTIQVVFSSPSAGNYTVSFTELGLPSGTSWSVDLNATSQVSTDPVLNFTEANGSYPFNVTSVPGYTATPPDGTVDVNGSSVNQTVEFAPKDLYNLTFTESGLPDGLTWVVLLYDGSGGELGNSVAPDNISYTEPNGSYYFFLFNASDTPYSGFAPNITSGTVTLAGEDVNVSVSFVAIYAAVFVVPTVSSCDYGLYQVSVDHFTLTGNFGSDVAIDLPNGTYAFQVSSVCISIPSSGFVQIDGAPDFVNLTFIPYTVKFVESGLPNEVLWGVSLNTSYTLSAYTPTDNLSFYEKAGTYDFIASANCYVAYPATGTVSVVGSNLTVQIAFSSGQCTVHVIESIPQLSESVGSLGAAAPSNHFMKPSGLSRTLVLGRAAVAGTGP